MKRILMRLSKSPFDVLDAATSRMSNSIASNSGNLAFGASVFKTLLREGAQIDATYNEHRQEMAPQIDEQYEAFVIPLANAFRADFVPHLWQLTRLVKKLHIPCVVAGVGVQDTAERTAKNRAIGEAAAAFVSACLEKSASVGVRGEHTYQYLRGLGFGSGCLDVIGCPSLFYNGARLRVQKKTPSLAPGARVCVNLSKNSGPRVSAFMRDGARRFDNSQMVGQELGDLDLLLWGVPFDKPARNAWYPVGLEHELVRKDRELFFLDLSTWIEHLRGADFCFGTRVHGNIVSLLAGTPCMLVTTDARTLELAEYHGIPHITGEQVRAGASLEELYGATDYARVSEGHEGRFQTYLRFLERNGLPHIYADGAGEQETCPFDRRLRTLAFPGPVRAITSAPKADLEQRLNTYHFFVQARATGYLARVNRLQTRLAALKTAEAAATVPPPRPPAPP